MLISGSVFFLSLYPFPPGILLPLFTDPQSWVCDEYMARTFSVNPGF